MINFRIGNMFERSDQYWFFKAKITAIGRFLKANVEARFTF